MSNRMCQQCGAPLAPGQEFCGNCGAHYIEPDAVDPTQRAASYQNPGAPGPAPLPPTQYAGPSSSSPYPGPGPSPLPPTEYAGPSSSAASPYDNSPYGSTPYGSPSTSYGSQGQSYAPPPPPPSNVPYAGVPNAYGQQQPGRPVGGFPQAPQPKKGPNIGLIIGIIALIVVVVGAGIFLVTRPRSGSGNTGTTSNPTSVGSSPTIPTTLPTPRALFSDNFADNSQGWSTGTAKGISRVLSNHMFTLADTNQNQIAYEILPTNATFDNFTLTASLTFIQGDQNDGIGLYVRGDNNLNHDYRIEIYGDSTYAIYKEYLDSSNNSKQTALVNATSTPSLHPTGQENKITVVMKGSTLVLLINDTPVKTITDSDYTSGQIALFVEHATTSNGVKASFSSVAVYPAPDQLPS